MNKLFFVIATLFTVLCSCHSNDTTTDIFLQQPPFDKFTDSIKNEPGNADLYYRRSLLLFDNNQLGYAEQDAKRAWNLSPKEEYGLAVATILTKRNQDSAIQFLQQAIKTAPKSIALKISLAKSYQNKKEPQKALAVCKEVSDQYPNQIDALLLQAKILKEENKGSEALAILEKAYSFAPFDVELAYNLAFEYAQAKNPKAVTLADSLLNKDSAKSHGEPFYFKGLYFENTGNNSTAIQYLNQAIQHDYYFLDAYMEKGQILYNQKNYEAALKTFGLAATVSPTFADAYLWMGKCNEATNNKQEAKLNYQRAYGLDKSLTEAKQAADRL